MPISTPSENKEYRVPVFVEGNTVALYQDATRQWKRTKDLSIPTGRRIIYFDINQLHDDALKQTIESKLFAILFNPRESTEIASQKAKALYGDLQIEYPVDKKAAAAAEAARKNFYIFYDSIPLLQRAILTVGTMPSVVLGLGNDLAKIVHCPEPLQKGACALHGKNAIYFTALDNDGFDIVLEEICHAAERKVEENHACFTLSPAWINAIKKDMSPPHTMLNRLYERHVSDEKLNSSLSGVHDEQRPLEALADLIRIEHGLILDMRKDRSLTAIGGQPGQSIDDIMGNIMPNMWKLYRGPGKNHQLAQNKDGEVMEIKAGGKAPPGFEKVTSYAEACRAYLQAHDPAKAHIGLPELPEPGVLKAGKKKGITPNRAWGDLMADIYGNESGLAPKNSVVKNLGRPVPPGTKIR